MTINTDVSTIILNSMDGMLQSKDMEWQTGLKLKKHEPTICCLQEAHLWAKDTHKMKWGNGKRYFMQMKVTGKW